MYTILVCDDDKDIVDAIQIYLSAEGYHVIKAYDGKEALEVIKSNEIHLVLLDIMMPQMDGIRVTMKLRENNSTLPIILLTAKSEDSDKVLGLNVGADDYITKPFSPLELIARVKSSLRRYTKLGSIVAEEQNIYSSGGLIVNDDRKEVYVDDELIKLTPIEYNLLKLLVKNKGRVFSINEIYELIWNEPSFGADNIVAVHIRHIREKIEINPKEPKYLKVAWGIGYKIEKY
jgi:DNA-binding response OmpR family regulator